MNKKDKIIRLERLLGLIRSSKGKLHAFDELYKELEKEYFLENSENGSISYSNNLKQTINKQAKSFILAKRKWKSDKKLLPIFSNFLNNFQQDITGELSSLIYDVQK